VHENPILCFFGLVYARERDVVRIREHEEKRRKPFQLGIEPPPEQLASREQSLAQRRH
jgi:hypothetical protein